MDFNNLFGVEGKVVCVTGGGGGIGRGIAGAFVAGGARVYITSRSDLQEAADELAEVGPGECIPLRTDLSSDEDITALGKTLDEREGKLDVLVNNAGMAAGGPLEDFPEESWDRVMESNVKGPFFMTQRLLPYLEAAASDNSPTKVINIGSVDGVKVSPFPSVSSYGPSKAAVHQMTRMLAAHLNQRNVLVNAIAPGPFPTVMLSRGFGGGGDVENTDWDKARELNPRERVGLPEEIAGLAIMLGSRASDYIVGEVITCDGGYVSAGARFDLRQSG